MTVRNRILIFLLSFVLAIGGKTLVYSSDCCLDYIPPDQSECEHQANHCENDESAAEDESGVCHRHDGIVHDHQKTITSVPSVSPAARPFSCSISSVSQQRTRFCHSCSIDPQQHRASYGLGPPASSPVSLQAISTIVLRI